MPSLKTHQFAQGGTKHSTPKLDLNGERRTSTERTGLYDRRWRQARAIFLRRNPLCAACASEGRVCVAAEVDHIIPHKGDLKLFWDKTNWQALCASQHSRKTAREVNSARKE
jgi:5-methylcytosine-specific restriction protein A